MTLPPLRTWIALGLLGCQGYGTYAAEPLPTPAQTPATVIVSGRTSTFKEVKIQSVGTQIPKTFSGDRVKNAPGFSWHVSQHYALKTDYPEAKARFYLTLLELAYPHYVELFGKEPVGISEKRMAVVYASSAEQLKKALAADGIVWNFGGGGITYEGYNCAYQFPSGTLAYHQRYILLHECTHLFQLCLNGNFGTTPGWYYEGIADALGHHVYDEKKQQLTVNVCDHPIIENYFDSGLARHRKEPLSFEKMHKDQSAGREINFLAVHYLSSDPERLQKFRIWRDELFRAKLFGKQQVEMSSHLMQQLFGPWEQFDRDYRKWLDQRQNTFHYVQWGWEQDANTIWAYGFADGGKLSQTDVNLPPGQKPVFDPLRMDYPSLETPALVGKVERGVAQPSVGCLIDFSPHPGRGRAGIGLGVVHGAPKEMPGMLRLLLEDGKRLAIDGTDLGLERKVTPLPEDFLKALAAGKHLFGLNARIADKSLEVTLRAQPAGAKEPAIFKASVPLTPAARTRLLEKPLALLARDGYHRLTPFFDDLRRLEPDLLVAAPANRWRNPGDRQLSMLYRASWRLGDNVPPSLERLRKTMRVAADHGPEAQKQALDEFKKSITAVRADVSKFDAAREVIDRALAEFSAEGEPSELEKLKTALQNPEESVRVDAIRNAKIAEVDARRATELLLAAQSDKSGAVQRTAIALLVKLLAGDVKDWQTRRAIALGLAKFGGDGIAGLIDVVENSTDPTARAEAIFALGTLRSSAKMALEPLVKAVHDPSLHVRTRALSALDEIAPAAVLDLFNDPDAGVRAFVLGRLQTEPARKAKATLLKLLRDPDGDVRTTAARALGRIGISVVEDVEPLLRDEDPRVRRAAIQALESHATLAALGKLLEDDKIEVREAVAETLAKRGAGAFPALAEGLRSKNYRVQKTAANAIVPMEDRADDLIPVLVEALLAREPEELELTRALLRVNPVLSSRELARKAQTPALIALLKKDIPEAQILACLALMERDGPADDAMPILTELIKNPKTDVNVLAAAARAVNALGPKDAVQGLAPGLVARLVQGTHEKSRLIRNEIMAIPGGRRDSFEAILSDLYLGEFTGEANDWVIHHANASSTTGWSSPNFARVLSLFHRGNKRFEGRLTPAAEQALRDHFWRFLHEPTQGRGQGLLPIPLADVKVTFPIDRLVWTTSAYLALEILKDDPAYKDRKIHGKRLPEVYEEWTLWWREWAKHRPMFGLWSEMGLASHQFHIWPCLLNMVDCASDPVVKQRFKMLLDLTVIEEEQISMHGARAGRRGKKTGVGCGIDQWKDALFGETPRRLGEACAGFSGIVWTSSYEMPTAAILLRKLGRPVSHYAINNQHFFNGAVAAYATPHYILASQFSQPRGTMEFHGIWHRLIFDDMNAIFFPLFDGERRHMQHQNVYMTRSVGGGNARRSIEYSANLKTVERDGWFFASNGPGYVGIYVVGGYELEKSDRKELGPQKFNSVVLKIPQSTVLLHAGDVQTFASFEKFQAAILQAPLKVSDESLHYAGPKVPPIEFFHRSDKDALVAGVPHKYRGENLVFDSPYLRGTVGSSEFTVQVGSYSAVYDFEKSVVTEVKSKK